MRLLALLAGCRHFMRNDMSMDPEMSAEQRLEVHEMQLHDLRGDVDRNTADLTRALKYITGNGDPSKGLMWIAADAVRMNGTLTQILEQQRLAFEAARAADREQLASHIEQGHYSRQPWYFRMGYDIAKNVAVWATIAFIGLAVLGARVSIAPPIPK